MFHVSASAMLMSPAVSSAVSILVLSNAMRILCCNVSKLDGSLSLGLLNLKIAQIMTNTRPKINGASFIPTPYENYHKNAYYMFMTWS